MEFPEEYTQENKDQIQVPINESIEHSKLYKPHYSLLGEVDGVNFRLQLVLIDHIYSDPIQIVQEFTYMVLNEDNFQLTVKKFLDNILPEKYPQIAVIGVIGLVQNNQVTLQNVSKWGQLVGQDFSKTFKIKNFVFLNDFIATSYGLLLLPDDNFVSLNGHKINPNKTRGVLGPSIGLGNSIICSQHLKIGQRISIFLSEGGHCDSPWINDLTIQFYKFLSQKQGISYISWQHTFCGAAIPYMYRFFAQKYPTYIGSHRKPTSQQIIEAYNSDRQADTLQRKTIEFFLDLYSAAICNFIIAHMCTGGLYLLGSLTNALIQSLKQTDIVKKFIQRHPELIKKINIEKIPIVVCKKVDLGLKGAFAYARRIIADQQHN